MIQEMSKNPDAPPSAAQPRIERCSALRTRYFLFSCATAFRNELRANSVPEPAIHKRKTQKPAPRLLSSGLTPSSIRRNMSPEA
jgi:hypothetical protein